MLYRLKQNNESRIGEVNATSCDIRQEEVIFNLVQFIKDKYGRLGITGITMYVEGAAHLNGDKMGLPNILKSFM